MESTLSARTNLQFALRNTKCLAFQGSRVKQKGTNDSFIVLESQNLKFFRTVEFYENSTKS
jgi:hypothetical protein